ncbi:MAG: hypothetical protein NW208_18870 [Bryobacter sp.]|nr:hypothetical protein [Bryobacter sp.]
MSRFGYSHLVVYADREHFANLAWLTGFDPRFEEALLILSPQRNPLLLTGIECAGYLPISPIYKSGDLRTAQWDDFSLPGIPRVQLPGLFELFQEEGINSTSRVGVVGWKEYADANYLDVPAYLADTLRRLTPQVGNAVSLFSHPEFGLRSVCSPKDIQLFEWGNIAASEGMKALIHGLREGATDHELAPLMGYNGSPQTCHWTLKTGPNRVSLASPRGNVAERGNTFSANLAYWGANCCRAGWLVAEGRELPEAARDYLDAFVGPYFRALKTWFANLRIGNTGGNVYRATMEELPEDMFHVKLNPGHLIHLEEWLSTPIYPESTIGLRAGMLIQSDIIPSHPVYFSTRMEDSYLIADAELHEQLEPALLERCRQRRGFMEEVLGYDLPAEVLPLSNLAGVIQPYLLAPQLVCTLR